MKHVQKLTALAMAALISATALPADAVKADAVMADTANNLPQTVILAENPLIAGNSIGQALEIQAGIPVQSTNVEKDQTDWFRFTATKQGYFQVTAQHSRSCVKVPGNSWTLEIYDDNLDLLWSGKFAEATVTTAKLPMGPGEYFIKTQSPKYSDFKGCTYELQVTETENTLWEQEYNNTFDDATPIHVNTEYSGNSLNREDNDYYRFVTSGTGYFEVALHSDVTNRQDQVHYGWKVGVYDEDGVLLKEENSIHDSKVLAALPYAKKGRVFYVKVSPANYYSAPETEATYDLKVIQTLTKAWEKETNDDVDSANSISLDQTYTGITTHKYDEDYFKISVPSAGKVRFRMQQDPKDHRNISCGWTLEVFKRGATSPVVKLDGIGRCGEATAIAALGKGTYYVKVSASNTYGAPVDCRYNLKTEYVKKPAAVKLSSVKKSVITSRTGVKKINNTITWKKVSGASGYAVYRKTGNGSYRKIKTLSSSTCKWTDSGLKYGKKYSYKVRAYAKGYGMVVWG